MPPLNYSPYPPVDQSSSPWMSLEDLISSKLAEQPQAAPTLPPAPQPAPQIIPDRPFPSGMGGGVTTSQSSTSILPESLSIWNKLINKQSEGLNLEKQGMQALSARKDAIEKMPQEMNWSGLMALADAWGTDKSNFSQAYRPPATPEDKAKLMFDLENQIQKAKQGYTDDEVKLLKSQLEASVLKEQKSDAKSLKKSEALNKYGTEVVKAYNNDSVVKKYAGAEEASGQVIDLLNSDNPLADNSIPTFVARASGEVGNLSEADKKPFGGSKALSERLSATAKELSEGRITDNNRAFIAKLADTMSQHAKEVQDKRARILAEQYGRANSEVSPKDVLGVIAPHLEYQPLEKGKPFQTTADKMIGKPMFRTGDIRQRNGISYQRQADGSWVELNQ